MRAFDLTTHRRGRDGQIKDKSPYRLHVNGLEKKFERPPGSGIFYYENGELCPDSKARLAEDAQKNEARSKGALEVFADQKKSDQDKDLESTLESLIESESKGPKRSRTSK